jgi:hypothetical protein
MNDKQILAIKCAYLDLIGVYQAIQEADPQAHDWKAHQQTIEELKEAFNFLEE